MENLYEEVEFDPKVRIFALSYIERDFSFAIFVATIFFFSIVKERESKLTTTRYAAMAR